MSVLSQRALNRALLARQLLLERADVALPEALERIGGIQAQYAPAMYVGAWTRIAGLERDALTNALEERRVIQATLMRSTIHLVAPGDYWPFALAVRDARRQSWLRSVKGATAPKMAGAARTVRNALADGPLTRAQIEELIGKDRARGVGLWVDMVRVPPSGTWERRRADLYGLAEDWLAPSATTPAAAVDHLVRSYLRGFGPATKHDVASYTGFRVGELAAVFKRLDLDRHESEDGRELLDVPGLPLPDPDTPAPVRFLPVWDATLLVHARRTGLLPEELRPEVFSVKKPHGTPTFLVDGAVAGAWRYDDGRVALEPWTKLDRATRRALDDEAERLAAFHA
ncbi:MAG TPA: winged helix DNA-binding domain-containing protein [Solirubrobacteraceae bacterium]|nr:winged helix DNA-binding domain-containing protein [Solirubrobacteraceae bacterium]